jgi:hypothetical protein
MAAAAEGIQITPREQEQAHRLYRALVQEGIAALIGPDGKELTRLHRYT